MQFKFKHSKLSFNVKAKEERGFNLIFSFAENITAVYQELTGNPQQLSLVDLSQAGAIATHNQHILVSCGQSAEFKFSTLSEVALGSAKFVAKHNIQELNLKLTKPMADKLDLSMVVMVEKFLVDFINGLYYFDEFKSEKHKLQLEKVNVISNQQLEAAISNSIAIVEGYFMVRDLANLPSNVATPTYLAEVAQSFAKLNKQVSVEILAEKEIKKLGMHAFLGVAKGSKEEPRLIKLEYKGSKKTTKPVVLVGKGITFDSGGISLKPGPNMDEMKYDMCGAATVLGVFAAVARLELAINLIVVVPSCENMPSGSAQKPGDIVTSMAGKTIEVLNTDAEGRLILCDALHYVKRFEPEWVIDVATLTGACIIALGSVASGLYVNDEDLANTLQEAAVVANDKVWRMPLFAEYKEALKGVHADLLNIGGWGGKAGSVTAACFLQEFVEYKWAHLDIAGVAFGGENKSSGRPFKLLLEVLRRQSQVKVKGQTRKL